MLMSGGETREGAWIQVPEGGQRRISSTREDIRRKLANFGEEEKEEEVTVNNNLEVREYIRRKLANFGEEEQEEEVTVNNNLEVREDIRRKLANFGEDQEEEVTVNNNLEVRGGGHVHVGLRIPSAQMPRYSYPCYSYPCFRVVFVPIISGCRIRLAPPK